MDVRIFSKLTALTVRPFPDADHLILIQLEALLSTEINLIKDFLLLISEPREIIWNAVPTLYASTCFWNYNKLHFNFSQLLIISS